ncbi:MAG: DUF3786 domain-containing protein [Deltaproteobacteria bacterium]|jgi:hypothetical protein|nr:DUF3786 domain-containing protein [Deltaproteobacteria bacterium]
MEGKGYEQNYLNLIKELKGCDFEESAARLGLQATEGGARANFLGRDFIITEEGVEPVDGRHANPNYRSILIHYIISKGDGEPGDEFLAMQQLPGVFRTRTPLAQRSLLNGPLFEAFGEGHDSFKEHALALGGSYLGNDPAGGHLWEFRVLPKIRMRLAFVEADEEFPLEVRVTFDNRAIEFMGFECLAFLHGCLVHALVESKLGEPKAGA